MSEARLGASEFAAAIGVCPYTSRQKLWRRKMGIEPRETNAFIRWGIQHEPKMVASAERILGVPLFCTGEDQRKYRKGRFTVIPDGVPSAEFYLEGKVRASKYQPHDLVPEHYMCQCQAGIEIGGFEWVAFCSWTFTWCRLWRVPRSEEFLAVMMPRVHDYFWWLDTGVQPPRFKRGEKPKLPSVLVELIYEGRP